MAARHDRQFYSTFDAGRVDVAGYFMPRAVIEMTNLLLRLLDSRVIIGTLLSC